MISIMTCISYYMVSNTKIKDRRFHVYDYFAWLELIHPVYTHEVVGKVNPFYYLNNSVFIFAITSNFKYVLLFKKKSVHI